MKLDFISVVLASVPAKPRLEVIALYFETSPEKFNLSKTISFQFSEGPRVVQV